MGVKFMVKKRYVTLEWPLIKSNQVYLYTTFLKKMNRGVSKTTVSIKVTMLIK